MFLIGYDIGSSSIKATLLDAGTGSVVHSASSPDRELEIQAPRPGWAEQHPETWWEHVKIATQRILSATHIDPRDIEAIGISYQMHGLVLVDKNQTVLRPSIIWCDSRAVEIGNTAFKEIGEERCLRHLLNSPGNFTASKLKWVKDNEPDVYSRIHKAMLPGDYIAMKMSGKIATTPSGLSEGIMWDFTKNDAADIVLDYYGIDRNLIADVVPTFSVQGEMSAHAAEELGLVPGIKIAYRAGDQPNNALSLKVLSPGEIAATAGTSGVVYGVSDMAGYDPLSRVNPFVHVTHTEDHPRYGILMCINGTGILNSWIKHNCAQDGIDYNTMNRMAMETMPGADGISVIPYGNGAERTLSNKDIGAHITGVRFTTHDNRHLYRAAQEGIVFAFQYGLGIMRDMGVRIETVRAGASNMFQSPLFREALAAVSGAVIELFNTDGSQGAARGAGIGAGVYPSAEDAFVGLSTVDIIEPDNAKIPLYTEAYERWESTLKRILI